jgi:hypothetical protein
VPGEQRQSSTAQSETERRSTPRASQGSLHCVARSLSSVDAKRQVSWPKQRSPQSPASCHGNRPKAPWMRESVRGIREMCSFIHEVTPRAPTRLITRGSRLGSLYYDNITTGGITTLAILPRRIRHDQPNESRQRPCGRAAGWRTPAARRARPLLPREGQEHGVARWWGRHAAPQLEHMPSQWCTGCGTGHLLWRELGD